MTAPCQGTRFLVLSGSNDRAILAFLRTATRLSAPVSVVAMTDADLVLRSAYRKLVVHTRESNALTLSLLQTWVALVKRETGATALVIYPSSEYLNAFLLKHREEIEQLGCIIPLSAADIYATLTNKASSAALFARHEIAVPATSACVATALPLVAKPKKNMGASGRSLYPHLIANETDLQRFLETEVVEEFFYQRWVRGPSFYLFFYIPQGPLPIVSASQENLLQEPGGKSMLLAQPAMMHRTALADRCLGLLSEARFHGLCMIEFIEQDGQPFFIELNPRPWGPIQFCEDMGAPLLASFIAEWCPGLTVSRPPARRRYYAWTGGLLKTLLGRQRVATHGVAPRGPRLWWIALRNDVYLRRDSLGCFLKEVRNAISGAFHD